MVETDLPEFTAMLDAVCGLLSRGTYTPSDLATGLFFRALSRWPLEKVRAAFDAHVTDPQRGRFAPTPADLVAQLENMAADDGRPGAEEAWAIALTGRNEFDSVVWTQEIAEAWGIARAVHGQGDEVGGRMAFREAYVRIVEDARAACRPHVWLLAEGFDVARRQEALRIAADKGRHVAGSEHLLCLPPTRGQPTLLLPGPAQSVPESARAALKALRDRLAVPAPYVPGPDEAARERTAELKREAAAKVDAYRGAPA